MIWIYIEELAAEVFGWLLREPPLDRRTKQHYTVYHHDSEGRTHVEQR